MKYALIVSMGLFAAYCNAAESSIQGEKCVRPIILIRSQPTLVYDPHHVDLLRMDSAKKSMIEYVKWGSPCIWAMIHCKSSTASTGIRRKMRNASEIHNRVAEYNEQHTKHPIVRDPHYYLVWQDDNGALKGRFLGREKDALSEDPMYRDLKCMLTEPKLPVRALATMRQYVEGNLYNEAVNWYRLVLHGEDLAANDTGMDWPRTLYRVGELCFHNGEYTKAIEMGKQALFKFNYDEASELDILGLLCRAHVALQHWDEAINLACDLNPQCAWRGKDDAGVLKALAEAYEHKGSLEEALYTCAQVIDLTRFPRAVLENPVDPGKNQYALACMHLMYYCAMQKEVLGQLTPLTKDRLVIAAKAVVKIPELPVNVNEYLEETLQAIHAYQTRYPGRYLAALQEAHRLLDELGQEPNSSAAQDPTAYAIVAPEATDLPAAYQKMAWY